MLLSIAMPAYNHEQYVAEMLLSIKNQNLSDYEVLIVDDCSSDKTYEVIEARGKEYGLPLKLYRNEANRGILFTISRAASLASGKYLTFFNSDDVYVDNGLAPVLQFMRSNPATSVVYANGFYEVNGNLGYAVTPETMNLFKNGVQNSLGAVWTKVPTLFLQGMMIENEFFRRIGGFPKRARVEDWGLNIKIFEGLAKYKKTYSLLPQHLVFRYRLHPQNTFRNIRHVCRIVQTVKNLVPRPLRHLTLAHVYMKRKMLFEGTGDQANAERFQRLFERHRRAHEQNPPPANIPVP
jgi:glycosyltransferase involved in cell wall biosynthesis